MHSYALVIVFKEFFYNFVPIKTHKSNYYYNLKFTIMADNSIAAQVKAIIVEKLSVEESEVVESATFTGDLGADSLDTVEMIMEFEKKFGVSIPDEEAEKIATVGDAIAFIEKALA